MGCYMSAPDNRVYVTEGKGENFIYATASCQGWRRDQEDAEDCLPYFDDNASLFILCDGHGGAEVAKYTVEHLPNFIKNHPLYKQGKYVEALEESFVEFDALLRTDKVMEELHRLAFLDHDEKVDDENGEKVLELNKDCAGGSSETQPGHSGSSALASGSAGTSSSNNGSSTIVEDVDAETLRREAALPLSELLDEYSAISGVKKSKHHNLLLKYNASPVVRTKRSDEGEGAVENGEIKVQSSSTAETSNDQAGSSTTLESKDGTEPQQGPSTSGGPESLNESLSRHVIQRYFPDEDSSDDSEFQGASSNDDDGDDECDDEGNENLNKKLRRKKHKRPYNPHLNTSSGDSSDEDDDEDDDDDDDDDDEEEEDEDEQEDEDAEEEDDADDEEESDDNEDQWKEVENLVRPGTRAHNPGLDSGCTAVVALLKDGKLYVASVGDSRCIMIMRNGECKALSFDHKPENPAETKRVLKAGGHVIEGRINGGLNMSRALGDFTYKKPSLSAKDQMITPCPDVRTADLDMDKVEYIFLACDGIWNSMNNLKTARHICRVAPTVEHKLVDICLDIFRACIAPETDGDGTGCDNMTCILVRFDKSSSENSNSDLTKTAPEPKQALDVESQKRSNNDESDNKPTKRMCLRL